MSTFYNLQLIILRGKTLKGDSHLPFAPPFQTKNVLSCAALFILVLLSGVCNRVNGVHGKVTGCLQDSLQHK